MRYECFLVQGLCALSVNGLFVCDIQHCKMFCIKLFLTTRYVTRPYLFTMLSTVYPRVSSYPIFYNIPDYT